jgi:hypothetical protein
MTETSADVTFVITSCGRPDLLRQTLDSFVAHNSHPVARYILIEDSGDREMYEFLQRNYGELLDRIIFNEPRLGQIKSVDRAYAEVETPYIFHCEDDFEFFRSGFVEESLSVLRHDPAAITVWLRHLWDCKRHKIGPRIQYTADGVMYRHVLPKVSHGETWHGFTFNPALRRTADYRRIGPFADIGHELQIDQAYQKLGFHGVVLEEGATAHIGHGRHVSDAGEPVHRRVRDYLRRRRRERRERGKAR